MNKQQPDIIIATVVGGLTKYVFNAPLNHKNIRRPILTDDPEKAYRFFSDEGARQYIRRFPGDHTKYTTETFAPAAVKK